MRRLIAIIGLEAYAFCLAAEHLLGRVHTDEAKYLLNIPYPHPPLVRSLLSVLDGFPFQEFLVRFLFASLMAQAAWLAWDMGKGLSRDKRIVLAGTWLSSFAFIAGAGTVMMAPLTGLQGLVFLWLCLRKEDHSPLAGLIALLWLASLFTAYQAALFFPLVIAVFLRMKLPLWKRMAYVAVPVALLCLYTLTNPFALASMLNLAGKDAAETLMQRAAAFAMVVLFAGSFVLGIGGTYGLARSRNVPVLLSFALVSAYVFLGHHFYYAILFVPFFVAGLLFLLRAARFPVRVFAALFLCGTAASLYLRDPVSSGTPSREVMGVIAGWNKEGIVLIQGDFGHDWQYETRYPVYRYTESLLPQAQAVVCLEEECPVRGNPLFHEFPDMPVELWMRQ